MFQLKNVRAEQNKALVYEMRLLSQINNYLNNAAYTLANQLTIQTTSSNSTIPVSTDSNTTVPVSTSSNNTVPVSTSSNNTVPVSTDSNNTVTPSTNSNIEDISAIRPYYSYLNPFTSFTQTPSSSVLNSIPSIPPMYYSGTQLLNLYNIPSISPNKNARKVVIAIVVAYHYDNLLSDLNIYWKNSIHYGANSSPPQVIVHNLNSTGSTNSKKSISTGWAQEECLDVQMVCMVAPNANIHVIEANSDSCTDLNAAVQYAVGSYVLADVVSMSWGGADTASNNSYSSIFTSSQNVCFCAASGDSNAVSWPSVLANCISVGGTTLVWNPSSTAPSARTEYTWPTAGCGYSATVAKPIYQNAVNSTGKRSIPDISLIANPLTSVYIVYNQNWYGLGGTSVATPIFSAILALANQQRLNSGKVTLTSIYTGASTKANHVQTHLYNIINTATYPQVFNDITIGQDQGSTSTGGSTVYTSGVKFDIATGLGSPNGGALITLLNGF